jgi:hypothetical protein
MRRFLSFLMASAILLAGLTLAGFEIVRAGGVRPFVLFGALVMVVISGAWLSTNLYCGAEGRGTVPHNTRVAM